MKPTVFTVYKATMCHAHVTYLLKEVNETYKATVFTVYKAAMCHAHVTYLLKEVNETNCVHRL